MIPNKVTSQQIYDRLKRMIMDLELMPGARTTETELADQFRVSRTPVREALHRLETEGLLEIRSKQGCFIRQIDVEEISDFYDVRVGLEVMAIELACKKMPDEAVEALAAEWNPATHPKKIDYPSEIQDVEERFHITLAELSGNRTLTAYLRDVNDHIRVVRRLGFPDDRSIAETYEEHYQICQFILNRDVNAAINTMILHIRKSQAIARSVTLCQIQQQRTKVTSKAKVPSKSRRGN